MLKLLPNLGRVAQNMLQASKRAVTGKNVNSYENCLMTGLRGVIPSQHARALCASPVLAKAEERRAVKVPKRDEGTEGETNVGFGYQPSADIFPDENTPNLLVDGVKFSDLPICNVRVTKNNTIFSITTSKGVVKMVRSCGMEGFKNARKGTNIAAQATGISMAVKAANKGYKNIRLRIRGLGPGRMSSVKGLELGGLNIISITDATRVGWNVYRPRKARRL